MTSALEPRQVQPGALRRWLFQATALLKRSPGTWLLSSTFFGGLGLLVSNSAVEAMLVGLWAHIFFQRMANRADHGRNGLASLADSVTSSVVEVARYVQWNWLGLVITFLACCGLAWAMGLNLFKLDANHELEKLGDAFVFSGYGFALFVSTVFVASGRGFTTFGYLVGNLCHGNVLIVAKLTRKAWLRNSLLALRFDAVVVVGLMLASVLPVLALLAGPFIGAFSYVAFREVYCHDEGNHRLATKSADAAVGLSKQVG